MTYSPNMYSALNYITLSSKQEQVSNMNSIDFNDSTDSGVVNSGDSQTKKDMLGDCLAVSAIARTPYSTGSSYSSGQEYSASKNYYLNTNNQSPEKLGRTHSSGYSQGNDYSEYAFDKIFELDIDQDNGNVTHIDVIPYSYILFFRVFK